MALDFSQCDFVDFENGESVCYVNGQEVARENSLARLQPGSAPSPGTTTLGADGKALPMVSAPVDPLTAAPAATTPTAPAPSSSGSTWYDEAVRTTTRRGGGSGAYYDPSYGYSPGYGSFGGDPYQDDPFAGLPPYADGSVHPASPYGTPRVPGGIFAQPDDGYDDRIQVTSTSGATAGPYGVRAAPAPDSRTYGGSADGGGGGSLAEDMISRIRGHVMSKVGGMGPGGSGSSYGSTSSSSSRAYRRQGRHMDRAYERYNEELADPDPLPVSGWAKRQGFKPGTIQAVLSQPSSLLPYVFDDINPKTANATVDPLIRLPMTDLALMTYGTRGRSLLSKTPIPKVPHILRKEAGVKPIDPEYPYTLDPSKVANKIALMYRQLGSNGTERLSTEGLLDNLAQAKGKTAVRQGIKQQADFDPGGALASVQSYVRSAMNPMGADNATTRSLMRAVDRQLALSGGSFLERKPEKVGRSIRQMVNGFR